MSRPKIRNWSLSCTFGEVSTSVFPDEIDDYYGQLGVGCERVIHNLPKVCSFNIMVKQVSCGEEHTVFVSGEGGYVYAMGNNADGKLGIGNDAQSSCNVPTLVEGIFNIKKVACGMSHTLAVSENGIAYAWGQSFYGALGISAQKGATAENVFSPKQIMSL